MLGLGPRALLRRLQGDAAALFHDRLRQRRFDTQAAALTPACRRSSIRPGLAENSTAARLRIFIRAQSETDSNSVVLSRHQAPASYFPMVTSSSYCISPKPPTSGTSATTTITLPPILPFSHSRAPWTLPRLDHVRLLALRSTLDCVEVTKLWQRRDYLFLR